MPEVILIYLFCLSCDFRETGFQSCKFWPLILQPHLPVVDRCSPRSSNSHPTQTRSLLPGPRDQLFASCQQFQILKELPVFVSKKISFLKTKITFCKLDHPQYSICTNQTVTDLLCETMFFLHDCLLLRGPFLLASSEQIHEEEKEAPLPPPGYGGRKILQYYLWRDYFLKASE